MWIVYGRDRVLSSFEFLKEINEMLKCLNNLYGPERVNPTCPLKVCICCSVIHLHFTSSLLLLHPTLLPVFPGFWHTDKEASDYFFFLLQSYVELFHLHRPLLCLIYDFAVSGVSLVTSEIIPHGGKRCQAFVQMLRQL